MAQYLWRGVVNSSTLSTGAVNGSVLMEKCCKWLNIYGEVL